MAGRGLANLRQVYFRLNSKTHAAIFKHTMGLTKCRTKGEKKIFLRTDKTVADFRRVWNE